MQSRRVLNGHRSVGTGLKRGMRAPFARPALIIVAALLLAFTMGLRPVAEFHDLACPAGTVVRAVSVSDSAVTCQASVPSAPARSVPTSRYIGLFLTTVNVRVFDMDFMSGNFGGPARNVHLGR